ncbi:MAG: two-component sensor histidine kinase [Verrucomicrobia bacterium]|nr:MAG: two-component sensor histidine kinase [Verrucomicrobiota bacterium]
MFLSPTRPRSIASQLVLLFTLAAAFLLSCGLGTFYLIVVRHAFEEDNEFLADRLSALRGELSQTGGLASLTATVRSPRASKVEAYWVRVMNSKGYVVTETPKMNVFLPPSAFPDPQDKNSIYRPKNYRISKKLFSLVATIEEADGQPYIIQLAQDRSSDEQFATQFAFVLGGALGLGILASAMIAIAVTKRGLWPLQQMTQSLERIGPAHLDERVGKTTWPRELQPVATAFDEMLARLENSFTKLSQFSADLAHELRTPISNIRGEAEVTLTRPRTSEDYRNVIESIAAECERLSGIVDNLLFLARAEGVDRQIERGVFAARPAIEKIAAYYRTIAEERGISITNKGDGDVCADALLFDRALSNLLDNALCFTPDGGKITIATKTKPDRTELAVEDTGCGIPPQHLPHVCDRFYRVDSSRSPRGTGLGLALVKSITDLHGGSVTVSSEVNRGTTVTLIFPTRRVDDLSGAPTRE